MSNSFSRSQILKATGAFIAGAAAAKSLPLIRGEPAQAQTITNGVSIRGGGTLSFLNPTNPVPYVGLDYNPTIDALRIRGNLSTTFLNTDYVTIKRVTGNVGIGTTNPLEKLVVVGNLRATGTVFQGSSRELKENITELSSHEAIKALDAILLG